MQQIQNNIGVVIITTAQLLSTWTWTQFLLMFKTCSRNIGDSQWWGSLTMVPARAKAKSLSSVNCTTKQLIIIIIIIIIINKYSTDFLKAFLYKQNRTGRTVWHSLGNIISCTNVSIAVSKTENYQFLHNVKNFLTDFLCKRSENQMPLLCLLSLFRSMFSLYLLEIHC